MDTLIDLRTLIPLKPYLAALKAAGTDIGFFTEPVNNDVRGQQLKTINNPEGETAGFAANRFSKHQAPINKHRVLALRKAPTFLPASYPLKILKRRFCKPYRSDLEAVIGQCYYSKYLANYCVRQNN